MSRRQRAQLVAAAGALVAVALIPMVLAYLQLSYLPTAAVAGPDPDPTAEAVAAVEDAAVDAAVDIAGEYPWTARQAAAAEANRSIWVTLRRLEGSRVEQGVARQVSLNGTAASTWANESCPGGPDRAFGPCEAIGGLVLQERAGEATLVAVAVDVRAVDARGWTEVTAVVTVGAGP